MKSDLLKLKKKLLNIKRENVAYINADDIEDVCKYLSKEAGADFKKGCKDGYIGYSKMSKETLIELTEKLVIAGAGKETVIIIDDI